ncbi:MAG: hypothetical protein GX971_03420 [Firmicutes bacterium]|nr:hypothetical protein [Bacillota bacterium]
MNMNKQGRQMVGCNRDLSPQEAALIQPSLSNGLVSVTAASPIFDPDAAYLAATSKIDISGLPFASLNDSISDGDLTVAFSIPLEKLGPVPDGWATWSSPPFSEDPNPDVLYASSDTLTLELSRPVTILGFELEPSPFQLLSYTADFYLGNTLVESITRDVDGAAGARLFAREDGPIDRVVITGSAPFAIAQVRYDLAPSPSTFLFLVLLILLLILALILL